MNNIGFNPNLDSREKGIKFNPAGLFFFDVPQQKWTDESDIHYQKAFFCGHEMTVLLVSDDETEYELQFLGLMLSGFKSIDEAKKNASKFAKYVLHYLSMMITD